MTKNFTVLVNGKVHAHLLTEDESVALADEIYSTRTDGCDCTVKVLKNGKLIFKLP